MKNVVALWLLLFSVAVVSCKDEKEENFENVPGASGQTWEAVETAENGSAILSFDFTAATDWTAASDQAEWCKVTEKGSAGASKLTVMLEKNSANKERTACVTITFQGYQAVSFDVKQAAGERPKPTDQLEIAIDEYLSERYLWNDEYNTMDIKYNIPYVDDNNNFFHNTLFGMKTNVLDKKLRADGSVTMYSYIMRTPLSGGLSTRAGGEIDNGIEKAAPINSYGIASVQFVQFVDENNQPTGTLGCVVQTVYPDSPAEKAGVVRGIILAGIDGKPFKEETLMQDYMNLLYPSNSKVTLTINAEGAPTVELTSEILDPTPIIAHEVLEEGGVKIGYLHYGSFDAAYDNDLLDVIKDFKSQGINELILDLRYNGGGHVITSNMLSTLIAGEAANGKVYQYYRYNDTRMANVEQTKEETGMEYSETEKRFYEELTMTIIMALTSGSMA